MSFDLGETFRRLTQRGSRQPDQLIAPARTSVVESAEVSDHYLQILETYQVQWDLEKAARDALQNFFDINQTLDGIDINVGDLKEGFFDKQKLILMTGPSEYDYRKLLHIGGTSKDGRTDTAGGFGEGAKVMALVLLRDHGFRSVKFGSADWEVEFYLADVPEGSYDKNIKGLFARVSHGHNHTGNFLELVAPNGNALNTFLSARDFFYYSNHPHFQNPTAEVVLKSGARLGFKFLGQSGTRDLKGCLYDAGQRRHYEKDDSWFNVEECHIWAIGLKCFSTDRDRGAVGRNDVEKKLIKPLIANLPSSELLEVFEKMHALWSSSSHWNFYASVKILDNLIDRMQSEGMRLKFNETYIAKAARRLGDNAYNDHIDTLEKQLVRQGYTICYSKLSALGMKTSLDIVGENLENYEKPLAPVDLAKIDILKRFQEVLNKSQNLKKFPKREIKIFKDERAGGIIAGEFSKGVVWLKDETLRTSSFWNAAKTLLHELDHEYGTDTSSAFSYALTDTLGAVGVALTNNPGAFQDLIEEWNKSA